MPQLPDSFLSFVEEQNRAASKQKLQQLYELLDCLNGEQLTEVMFWFAEHPIPKTDPVKLAIKQFNALTEREIFKYMNSIKSQFDSETWELLSEK